jgi:hypothetical protein
LINIKQSEVMEVVGEEMPEGRSLFVFFFAFFGIHHDDPHPLEKARFSRFEPARKA